jgi:hypothetical protein
MVEEHLHEVLGRQARERGEAAAAARHYARMLGRPSPSPHLQRIHLSWLMEALQEAQQQAVGRSGACAH